MPDYLGQVLHGYASELKAIGIGVVGLGFKGMWRRDVPWWAYVLDALIILPLAVFLVAPAAAELFDLPESAERAIVFILGAWGRDIISGLNKLAKLFGANPEQFWPWRKR